MKTTHVIVALALVVGVVVAWRFVRDPNAGAAAWAAGRAAPMPDDGHTYRWNGSAWVRG